MLASLSYAFLFSLYILSPSPLPDQCSEQRHGLPPPSLCRAASAPSPCPHNSLKEHNPSTKIDAQRKLELNPITHSRGRQYPPPTSPIRASSGTLNALWQKISLDPSQPGWLEASRSGFCPLARGTGCPLHVPRTQGPVLIRRWLIAESVYVSWTLKSEGSVRAVPVRRKFKSQSPWQDAFHLDCVFLCLASVKIWFISSSWHDLIGYRWGCIEILHRMPSSANKSKCMFS